MTYNVLLVGQVYVDTILTVDHFPEEDTKLRTTDTQERKGGNCLNTAEVLCQFPNINPFVMSALGPQNTSKYNNAIKHFVNKLTFIVCSALLEELESKGIKTSTCLFRKEPTPSSYIIQSSKTGSRTIISCNT